MKGLVISGTNKEVKEYLAAKYFPKHVLVKDVVKRISVETAKIYGVTVRRK